MFRRNLKILTNLVNPKEALKPLWNLSSNGMDEAQSTVRSEPVSISGNCMSIRRFEASSEVVPILRRIHLSKQSLSLERLLPNSCETILSQEHLESEVPWM